MTITVDKIDTFTVRLPTRADFRWNGLDRPLGEVFVVRITSGSVVGWGETVPLPDWGGPSGAPFGETPRIDEIVLHDLVAPAVLGRDASDLRSVRAAAGASVIGYPYALGAFDVALHDLVARSHDVPVYELLGGRRRGTVPIAHMIGLMEITGAEREAAAALDEGCWAFQIKGGQDVDRDVELVGRLRALAGDGVSLRLDANCGYGDAKRGTEAVGRLADAGIDLVEQPVGGREDLRRVTERSSVPILADELCWSPADALALIADRVVDGLSVYVGKAGGMSGAAAVTQTAAAANMPHDLNGSLEAGIGNAANLHVAAASDAQLLPCVLPINGPTSDLPTTIFGRYFSDDIIRTGLTVADGAVVLGNGPGLGIEVDEEKLERYAVSHRTSDADATPPLVHR
ncbi:MAG: mandelate racemase/muconate lactonizing enzyme family protein [Solirubrobacteraceae bacterium]